MLDKAPEELALADAEADADWLGTVEETILDTSEGKEDT